MNKQVVAKMKRPDIPVVAGIGTSAGGLKVLQYLVGHLPRDLNMCFIIVQHLDPSHTSRLDEILRKTSILPVMLAEDGRRLESANIYIIPPNAILEVSNLKIKLTSPLPGRGPRNVIDLLFRSMAGQSDIKAVGIILSGAGNDGSEGIQMIKEAGGFTIAQNPETARHASMPESAIATGCIDQVLHMEEIPGALATLKDQFFLQESNNGTGPLENLESIASILNYYENFDLKQYKPSTVKRRIFRRMNLVNVPDYSGYLSKLREDPDERKILTKDLLINVTNFFRDEKAFEIISNEILPKFFDSGDSNNEIRIWVAGCATGEEAYSLAILLLELRDSLSSSAEIRIFATDIDDEAIQVARKGEYPDAIAKDIKPMLLKKYFIQQENGSYKVKSYVRETISFAFQNVIIHPPFSNIDLVSCRNLLIYLQKEIQQKVFEAFHFSLKPNGYLILGTAETAGSDLFNPVSSQWKIYQKKQSSLNISRRQVDTIIRRRFNIPTTLLRDKDTEFSGNQIQNRLLRSTLAPTIVIDEKERIVYNHGNVSAFITIPEGVPNYNLYDILIPEIRSKVRSAIFRVTQRLEPVIFHFRQNNQESFKVSVSLLDGEDEQPQLWSITFTSVAVNEGGDSITNLNSDDSMMQNLETELQETKQQLQTTIEELETNSEELKAAHEEALSTNEELQSANEELEASSEELRSLNEELRTINDQLKENIQELQQVNNDVENFISSTNIPTIFLDRQFMVQRFTPAAMHLLKMKISAVGSPIHTINTELINGELIENARSVLFNYNPVMLEQKLADGRHFNCQITPYKTEDHRIEGVVITFQDVTDQKNLSRRAEARELQQATVSRLGLQALSGMKLTDLFDHVCTEIASTLDVDFSKILKYEPDRNELLLVAGYGWKKGLVGKATVPDRKDSQAGYTLMATSPVIVDDLASERRFHGPELLLDHGVVSGISCPINHSKPPFGVLAVHTKTHRQFDQDDANFLMSVANLLSIVIKDFESQDQLEHSEEQFRMLSNAIPQLAWMADASGAITWYNDRWYEFTGTSFEQMKGWGWQSVHHPDYVEAVTEKFKKHVKEGNDWEDTFPLRNKNGEYRWFLSRARRVRDKDNNIINWFGTNTDITEQLEIERALSESEEKLRIAKDSGKVGAFEFLFQADRVEIDSFLKDMWGVKSTTLTHDEFWQAIRQDDRLQVKKELNTLMSDVMNENFKAEFQIKNISNGEVFHVQATGQVIREMDIPAKLLGMIIDMSDRKALETDLMKAVARLENVNMKKNEFLATLGHELRNPLASIHGALQLLSMEDRETEELKIMEDGVKQMSSLLDDLLDLTRIERGKIKLNKNPINITQIFLRVARSYQSVITDKEYSFSQPSRPYFILGDETRVEQIIFNLLSNANKFCDPGDKIELIFRKRLNNIVIQVSDTGRGFSVGEETLIFEPFKQLDLDKHNKGLGIGLSLVKQFVNMHDATIEAHSDGSGKGATFTVTFPLLENPEPSGDQRNPVSENTDLGKLMMIVDDNTDSAKGISAILKRKFNIRSVIFENGTDALAELDSYEPEIFILDIGLPDMDGYELIRRIKSKYSGNALYIAHSGYGHQEAIEKSKDAGFDYHLNKPINLEELYKLILGM